MSVVKVVKAFANSTPMAPPAPSIVCIVKYFLQKYILVSLKASSIKKETTCNNPITYYSVGYALNFKGHFFSIDTKPTYYVIKKIINIFGMIWRSKNWTL
jgi:hypothetical protein